MCVHHQRAQDHSQMVANKQQGCFCKQSLHYFITFTPGRRFGLQNNVPTSLIRLEELVWLNLEPTRRLENKFRTEPGGPAGPSGYNSTCYLELG